MAKKKATKKKAKKKASKKAAKKASSAANLGFEDRLWASADKLRGSMDAAEYKHDVLGLIFLKYISDAFEERYNALNTELSDLDGDFFIEDEDERENALEERDEYTAENVFWVPRPARWHNIQNNAKQSDIEVTESGKQRKVDIGGYIDHCMAEIERENPKLKGVLHKNYARQGLDKSRLGELIDLISGIGLGDKESRSKDVIGRVYEYFLGKFADKEGKLGGEFYTPASVVRLLVEMIEPYKGRVFDPCCGSGGMFVQSEKFVESHGGSRNDISIYGQEMNRTTWRLCVMNLAIRGIEAQIEWNSAGSFLDDAHKDLKADYILANPPFNVSDWGAERVENDARWKYGMPPKGNANFGWVQHFIHHLGPKGIAGFVLANGSMSSMQSGEGNIREAIIKDDLVDCMVAMPGQLFYTTGIPVCLWFLTRNKARNGFRERKGETLFIDARKLGHLVDRTHRELSDEELLMIADTYHAWRSQGDGQVAECIERRKKQGLGPNGSGEYQDVPGFCKVATLAEIEKHGFVLTPGRYVGAAAVEDDGEPFEEKMPRLLQELDSHFAESRRLEDKIKSNLGGLGL